MNTQKEFAMEWLRKILGSGERPKGAFIRGFWLEPHEDRYFAAMCRYAHPVSSLTVSNQRFRLNIFLQRLNFKFIVSTVELPEKSINYQEQRKHLKLFRIPHPEGIPNLSWDEFRACHHYSHKTIALSKVLCDFHNTSCERSRKLLQWYCLFRGKLATAGSAQAPVLLMPQNTEPKELLYNVFSRKKRVNITKETRRNPSLPASMPILLRQILTDAWVSWLQLSNMEDQAANIHIADKHLSSLFQVLTLHTINQATQTKRQTMNAHKLLLENHIKMGVNAPKHQSKPDDKKGPSQSIDLFV
jgi:hypothetical protein